MVLLFPVWAGAARALDSRHPTPDQRVAPPPAPSAEGDALRLVGGMNEQRVTPEHNLPVNKLLGPGTVGGIPDVKVSHSSSAMPRVADHARQAGHGIEVRPEGRGRNGLRHLFASSAVLGECARGLEVWDVHDPKIGLGCRRANPGNAVVIPLKMRNNEATNNIRVLLARDDVSRNGKAAICTLDG
ncbi:hypothetical protein JR316_0006055 [Psilocybe cubensis]|uniref:Uncharacterized protein n=2 Tax=Psilocybe cubensis TaxID=181762 RepID=A0A8H7Y2J7_PSICU|nr:hypothetical protein JR316_0006055 [Psilocybe cubensis]KAH9481528.1 hypothetical protein JR316_0006055 [Psilocybe cubensis]